MELENNVQFFFSVELFVPWITVQKFVTAASQRLENFV